MKKFICILSVTLALIAGVFVCNTAYAQDVSVWNVIADVSYDGDVYRYDMSEHLATVSPDVRYLGAHAREDLAHSLLSRQLPPEAVYEYVLPGFEGIVRHFRYVERDKKDAETRFNGTFKYIEGVDGAEIDMERLFAELLRSAGRRIEVPLPIEYDRAVTVRDLRAITVQRGQFTTQFPNSSANRCHNISRAAAALDGVTVGVGETFSFNATVGARTEANGYKVSKVISNGVYTEGVGGGVCQVSTTLYNALLLANILPEAHRHSLVSSYVKAGFDAMVSDGGADLTFVNDTGYPLYISSVVQGKSVTFRVYGAPNPYRIVRDSVEEREPFQVRYVTDRDKYPDLLYTDQTRVVTSGSDGVRSKSYLRYYRGEVLEYSRLLRSDVYRRVDAVIARGYLER